MIRSLASWLLRWALRRAQRRIDPAHFDGQLSREIDGLTAALEVSA